MNISKERLLEIEKELNGLTIQKIVVSHAFQQWRGDYRIEHHCPHCNRSGIGWNFKVLHFDKCRLKGIDLEEFIKECSTLPSFKITKKYGVGWNFIKGYRAFLGIKEAVKWAGRTYNLITRICPHCNRPGKGNSFSRSHFDKCIFKGIDLTQLNEDILNYSDSVVQSKYGLTAHNIAAYKKYHKMIRKYNSLSRQKK